MPHALSNTITSNGKMEGVTVHALFLAVLLEVTPPFTKGRHHSQNIFWKKNQEQNLPQSIHFFPPIGPKC